MLSNQGKGSFDDLLNRVKGEQCEASFKALFEHFYPRVLAYFKRAGVKEQKCAEMAQETLLSVWRKAAFFDSHKGSSGAWIFTIARNIKFDHFRSSQRDVLNMDAEDIYDLADDASLQLDVINGAEDVRARIEGLPPEQKEAIYAMYFEGYSHGEFAEKKKLPLGTVKSRIRLALAQIKKGLEDL